MKTIFRFLLLVLLVSTNIKPLLAQWVQTNGSCGDTVLCFTVSSTSLFAGTFFRGVFRSTDNGTSWIGVNTGLTNNDIMSLTISGTDLFAATWGSGVFHSINNGTSWSEVNTGLTNRGILTFTVSGTNLFAGTSEGVFLTTNNGSSWSAVNTGLTNTYVLALAVSGTNLFAGTWGRGVFLTTNNGTSWSAVNTGMENTMVRALADSGTYLLAGTSEGVFLTANSGTNWSEVNNGLISTDVKTLTISGTNLFAGTWGGGVWRRPISDMITSVESYPIELPTDFSLSQNYPNPFNPSTLIKYAVKEAGLVKIKVYDILGSEVATLVSETKDAGNHSVEFNAFNLPSSVYIYTLHVNGFYESKKMLLLK